MEHRLLRLLDDEGRRYVAALEKRNVLQQEHAERQGQRLAKLERELAEEREKRERAEAKTLAVQSKSADKTQRIAELERELAEERELCGRLGALIPSEMRQRLSDLEREAAELREDCEDMAGEVIVEARYRHGDGKGGIHPVLRHRYDRDTETARKYVKEQRDG